MEWGILFTVFGLYAIKFCGFAREFLKKPEPRGPFQRPTRVLGRMPGEISMNDMTGNQLNQFIAALRGNNEYNEARKRGLIPDKVNWKEEGF